MFEIFPTEIGNSSFIVNLFFNSSAHTLSVCDTYFVSLPSTEQTTNLCFAIWLITSVSDDFFFRETHATLSSTNKTQSFSGCTCIITFENGMQVMTKKNQDQMGLSSLLSNSCDELVRFIAKSTGTTFPASPPLDEYASMIRKQE